MRLPPPSWMYIFQPSSLSYRYFHRNDALSLEVTTGLLLWGLYEHHFSMVTMATLVGSLEASHQHWYSHESPMNLSNIEVGKPFSIIWNPCPLYLVLKRFFVSTSVDFFVHVLAFVDGDLVMEFGERGVSLNIYANSSLPVRHSLNNLPPSRWRRNQEP